MVRALTEPVSAETPGKAPNPEVSDRVLGNHAPPTKSEYTSMEPTH